MSLRLLLALWCTLALSILLGAIALIGHFFWAWFGATLAPSVTIGSAVLSSSDVLMFCGVVLVALSFIVFGFLYIALSRVFVRPVVEIAAAMQTFTASQTYVAIEHTPWATELQTLAQTFSTFADSVEQVHARDMEISRVKSDFISTAAHQLRTPLTGIRWALQALEKQELTDDQKTLIQDAVKKSKDLVAIVGTLLDISSIESGKHKYVFESLDLADLALEVIHDFVKLAEERKVLLAVGEVPPNFAQVRADREQVKWILNNLVENAIRYTPAGGSVKVSFEAFPSRSQVLVRDTGIGITTKDRNNIFERFYRAENAVAKENQGNGLGLYISRTIATDHGGDLNFTPNPEGPGTTFTLSLPTIA